MALKTTKLHDYRDLIRFHSLFLLPWTGFFVAEVFGLGEFEFETELVVATMFFLFGSYWCGWFCPFGNVSYFISKIGAKLFPSVQFDLPKKFDRPLRYLKYVMLAIFVYALVTSGINYFVGEHMEMYHATWITSLYISSKKFMVLLLPLLIPRFFCKYLCFQKAGYNIINRIIPSLRIKRDVDACIDCKKCDKSCPSKLDISTVNIVTSEDCLSCFNCLDTGAGCPKKVSALSLHYFGKKVDPLKFSLIVAVIYLVATGIVLQFI